MELALSAIAFCHIKVTDELRECCYVFDDLHDYIQDEMSVPFKTLETGSSSEGVPFNDIDRMTFRNDFIAVETLQDIPKGYEHCILLLDTTYCYPGFARLKLHRPHPDGLQDLFEVIDGDSYLSSQKYINYMLTSLVSKEQMLKSKLHGPALLLFGTEDGTIKDNDIVVSLKCYGWPRQSKDFLQRIEHKDIPNITISAFHVVPVAHPESSRPDIEYRISFSVAEKHIIRKWSTKQARCYYLCKNICDNFMKPEDNSQRGLCSYFIKTVMFWMCEQKPHNFWEEKGFIECAQEIWVIVAEMVRNNVLPHYFIPDNNLISLFSTDQTAFVLGRIDSMAEEFFQNCNKAAQILPRYLHKLNLGHTMYSEQSKGYGSDFLRFSLNIYSHNEHINSKLFENVTRKLPPITNPQIAKHVNVNIKRCLAFYKLSDAFDPKYSYQKETLLSDCKTLFLNSMVFPNDLISDSGMTGYVHLGFFYYVTGDKMSSLMFMTQALGAKEQCGSSWKYGRDSVLLPAGKNNTAPRFLENDPLLSSFWTDSNDFASNQSNVIFFDPHVLCCYILYRITGSLDFYNMIGEFDETFIWSCTSKAMHQKLAFEIIMKGLYHEYDYQTNIFRRILGYFCCCCCSRSAH